MKAYVDTLHYELILETDPLLDIGFSKKTPLDWSTELFDAHLENDALVVRLKGDFDEMEARGRVEPFLQAWSIEAGLRASRPVFSFRFAGSTTRPDDRGMGVVTKTLQVSWAIRETLRLPDYPRPPADFAVSPLVQTLWDRYSAYKHGRETLAAMAYACLSFLEQAGQAEGKRNRRTAAAKFFGLDPRILSELGRLASTVGQPSTARKVPQQERAYTSEEVLWIERAVSAMIRQAGRRAGDQHAVLPVICLSDLSQER